jgi:hypothetical protein
VLIEFRRSVSQRRPTPGADGARVSVEEPDLEFMNMDRVKEEIEEMLVVAVDDLGRFRGPAVLRDAGVILRVHM